MTAARGGWDAAEMEAAARESEGGECYREIAAGEDHRVGIVATAFPSSCVLFSLEVSLRLCRTRGEVRPRTLARAAELSRRLEHRGYSLHHLDDGWIVCEKVLFKEDIATELEYLSHSVRSERPADAMAVQTQRAEKRGRD